jgi:hypothetical protein
MHSHPERVVEVISAAVQEVAAPELAG